MPKPFDPPDYLDQHQDSESTGRQNYYSSVHGRPYKVLDVLHDPAKLGQVMVMEGLEAREKYANP